MKTQLSENNSDIEEEISNIVVEFYDTASSYSNDNNQEEIHTYIESYINRVSRLSFRLAKSNFIVLRDACVIYHEILNNLNNRNEKLNEEQFQLFEVWPTLILAYISTPNSNNIDSLINFLQNPIWNYQVNDSEIKLLTETLNNSDAAETVIKQESVEAETESSDSTDAFDGEVFESIQSEVLEAMSSLISDLELTDDDDDFGINHAFYLCADRIELLGMSIATVGLIGLMDVCMLFQTGLRDLAEREKQLTVNEKLKIEEWTTHLIAYLNCPTDDYIIETLVEFINTIPWSDAMSEEEMMTLRLMLVPEEIEENEIYESNQEITEEHTSDKTEEINLSQQNELIPETDGSYEDSGLPETEEMYFLGQELIKLIHDEFKLEQLTLEEAIKDIYPDSELSSNNIDQLIKFQSIIERFSLATESIGLTGLNKILIHFNENLNHAINTKTNIIFNDDIVNSLKDFPKLSLDYLNDMDNSELINQLITPLYSKNWAIQLTYNKESLKKVLLSPRLIIEDDIEIRATQATADDVSLKLPEDVNQQLLSTLLQELPVQTEEFTQAITHLIDGNANLSDIEKAQRIAHTLKGAANTVGVTGIATLTHHIEDIFNIFTENKRLPGKSLSEILMNAADVLEMMSESLLGLAAAPEQAQNVLQQILDWANLIDQDGIPDDDIQVEVTQNTPESSSEQDTSHLNDLSTVTMLRVPATLMDELLRIAGESIILGGQLQERLRKATEQTELAHEQNTLYQQLVFDLEQIVDVQGFISKKPDSKRNEVFDSLELEQYNELHTVTHRLVEAATDSKELTHSIEDELNSLDTLMVDQSRLHKENQNIVMQTRMVPVQNIVPRLQRSIRQTSRTTGKKVLLDVTGTETLMDSDVLDELIDPLMHLLRNAIDHGIESEKVRAGKEKDLTGNIKLSFSRDGDHIVVRCSDDGAGLDMKAIQNTAIQKRFITQDQNLSEDELIRLVWLAGFTTRKTTTQVSGRGIGMDAVYNQITSMKGTINIASKKDAGCTIEIRLPVTLISIHAILAKLRKQTIAISNRGVEKILSPGDGELIQHEGKYTYHLNDEVYNAYDIETLLHQPLDNRNNDRKERSIFIVRDETGQSYAVSVERVIANQDLIVKQLGSYIPNIIGIEGATILGDGSVAPVLDLPGLIRTTANKTISPLIEQRLADVEKIEDNLVVLIVDDSLSARRSLAEFVKDIGYDVRMARDGIEAIEVIETIKPDIILVDLEMPRMNGLELTTHVRSNSETADIPVIMITSRSTEKHRDMADVAGINAYLTKPYSEDELLENIQNLLIMVN